jgi:hypothetical protein
MFKEKAQLFFAVTFCDIIKKKNEPEYRQSRPFL